MQIVSMTLKAEACDQFFKFAQLQAVLRWLSHRLSPHYLRSQSAPLEFVSEMETGRVTGRVEILRPAGWAGWNTGQIRLSCN